MDEKTISATKREPKGWLRFYLSEEELARAKQIAATKSVGYRDMLRAWIMERAEREEAA